MKLFLVIWLIVSLIAASIAFAPHPTQAQPTKSILILKVNGQIDSTLVESFDDYFQENPTPPDYLILNMNSSGGYYADSLVLARGLRSLENLGTRVYFFVNGTCGSGCYLVASFANQIYAAPNSILGFGHSFDELGETYMQIQVLLYANNRVDIASSGISGSPSMNGKPKVCIDNGGVLVVIFPFLDGCVDTLEILLSAIQNDSTYAYSVTTATLTANQELGKP